MNATQWKVGALFVYLLEFSAVLAWTPNGEKGALWGMAFLAGLIVVWLGLFGEHPA